MKIEKLKIKDLKPAEYNPRQATKQQEEHLKKSLEKFGVVEPVVVNHNKDRFNIIVGGHFRTRELKKLGHKEVDCVIVDLPLEEEKELNIRLNANTGDFDIDLLANNFELEDLKDWGLDLPELDIEVGEPEETEGDESKIQDNDSNKFLIECNVEDKEEIIEFIQLKLKETSFQNVKIIHNK